MMAIRLECECEDWQEWQKSPHGKTLMEADDGEDVEQGDE